MISDVNALQTHLINEAHSTPVTAHSDKTKTAKLLLAQYYWPGLSNDCLTFIINCWTCHQTHVPWDKTSDLLHSLPIEDKCWQHILFDFKFFLLNKKGLTTSLWLLIILGKGPSHYSARNSDSSSGCLTVLWVHLKDLQNTWDSYIRSRSSVYLSIHRWALQACESKAEAFNSLSPADWWEYWGTQSVHWSTTLSFCEPLSG